MPEVKRYPMGRQEFKLKDLHGMYKKETLVLNLEYQRSYVWERIRGKRERLIDSLLREFDIGTIFLRRVEKIRSGKPLTIYECLDGQQRLRAIFDFIEAKYPTSVEITCELGKPSLFEDLGPEYKIRLTDTWIKPVIVNSDDEDMISDIFMRLQEGVPLGGPEKLNAMRGEIKNAVVELSKHPFLKNTGISEYRFSYRYLCTQLMSLEINEVLESQKFVNMRYKDLKSMYESFADVDKKTVVTMMVNKVKSNLNFLEEVLNTDAGVIQNRSDAISIYLLASHLRAKYAISTKKDDFKHFVRIFLEKVETEKSSPWLDFRANRRRATTTGKIVQENFEIILREFLKILPDLELKDDKRIFDWGQKLAIYNIQDGKCKACGKPVHIKEADFHHKKPWDKGGRTTVKNGEMYHPEHHPL